MNPHSIADRAPMSKFLLLVLGAFLTILQFFTIAAGQNTDKTAMVDVKITVVDGPSPRAEIDGTYLGPVRTRHLALLNEYAGVPDLADRITEVRVSAFDHQPINVRRLNPGEYLADTEYVHWSYKVDLSPFKNQVAAAHVSWVGGNSGLLMLDSLLPQVNDRPLIANVTINLPPRWVLVGNMASAGKVQLSFLNVDKAVLLIGRNWREKQVFVSGCRLRTVVNADRQFSDDDLSAMAAQIFSSYLKTFGAPPANEFWIAVSNFPTETSLGEWEGDTRGNSVTIASADMPFRSQSLQRLHEQLRHEIFHLWIPEGVNLSGHYDWFYEGFALYQSLKLGVETNRIRFDDFLNTLSQAYNIDNSVQRHTSLAEASGSRWTGSGGEVYARGMLVAFMSDLVLMRASKGKISSGDLVREVYQKYHLASDRQDGNKAVLDVIRSHGELRDIAIRYITGGMSIDWRNDLATAGIEAKNELGQTTLKAVSKPSARQKDLLNKLGYNNWRKLSH
jgi:hypothetical protein